MTATRLYVDGTPLRIGSRIGKGGEGEVYLLEQDAKTALKLYTVNSEEKLRAREKKIKAMVDAKLSANASLVSFPRSLVTDANGRFKGFLMAAVRDHKVFHELYGPASRKHSFPKADYKFLVRVATNIARAVASVHRAGCVIGDINHSGILVSDAATVSLIDADSFQFEWKNTVFPCEVGVPEYTPPELQGLSFSGVTRTQNHDRFGLAVVIFQLLMMGRHPFSGTPRRGEMLPLHDAIRQNKFVYSETVDVGFDQPPGTPAISDISPALSRIFDRAFTHASRDPRPSAEEWIGCLEKLETELKRCSRNPMHYAIAPGDDCPWCEMEALANVILFIPPLTFGGATGVIGVSNGDLALLVAQLRSIDLPPRDRILPQLQPYIPVGSQGSATSKVSSFVPTIKKISIVTAVIALAIFSPTMWFIWIPLGIWIFNLVEDGDDENARVSDAARAAGDEWVSVVAAWQKKVGVESFLSKKRQAGEWAGEFQKLAAEKQVELNSVSSNRRATQLTAFLDGFEIRRAKKIKGIGPARLAQLISYGIETAADIERSRLLSVPGFGEAISRPLLEWRRSLEARFVYNPASNAADQLEVSRVNEKYRLRSSSLERSLRVVVGELAQIRQQITTAMSRSDATIQAAYRRLQDREADLRQRGLAVPVVNFNWPPISGVSQGSSGNSASSSSVRSSGSGTYRTGATPGNSPRCPRCGSAMHRRTAHRGTNAGGSFWGCSRFPVCRGTRN